MAVADREAAQSSENRFLFPIACSLIPCLSRPIAAVEGAVLDGLSQVSDREMLDAFQIRDGPGDFENAVVGARGQSLLLHGALQQALGVFAQFAIGTNLAGGHLGVGIDFFARFAESRALSFAGSQYARANLRRAFDGRRAAQLF